MLPLPAVVGGNDLQFNACGKFRLLEVLFSDFSAGKKTQAVADAAHVQALQLERLESVADDEFGGAAADVDHQPVVLRLRQAMRHAEVNQARLLAPGDDFDREPQDMLGLRNKIGGREE